MARSILDWVAWVSPGLLIVAGAVLFFIPLPPTTLIGIVLLILGAVLWVVDYIGHDMDRREPPRRRSHEE